MQAVANDIAVQMPGAGLRTSADIARAVRWTLAWEAKIPQEPIHVTVSDGWVMPEEQVERRQQRAAVARVVRRLADERGVINRITAG